MNKKIKCILIDLDGTIINSGPDLIDSLNFVLKNQNINPVERRIIGSLVGGGAKAMLMRAYQNLKLTPPLNIDSLEKEFLEFYSENCSNRSFLYPNVFNTLKKLKSKFRIALCTNKKQFITEKILLDFKIKDFFDCVLGSDSKIKLKPDTEMLEYCLNECHVTPEQAIMIGDSSNDIIPAKTLGMESIYVTYGYGKLEKSIKPNYIIDCFSEVLRVIKF
tara:strand:- start:217 stop:873 length:657 start_codon:yes stop_codon:yes gene_type:complete